MSSDDSQIMETPRDFDEEVVTETTTTTTITRITKRIEVLDNVPETPREPVSDNEEHHEEEKENQPEENQNNAITLKELIEQQRKKDEVFYIELNNNTFAKKITQQGNEDQRTIEPKYSVDKGEKYGRLRVGEVFRTTFHSSHHFQGNNLPKYSVLPFPTTPIVESLMLPSDDSKNRIIGNAYCSHSTNHSAISTKVYSTHRIIVIADPIHVAGSDQSAEQLCGLFYKAYENHFKMISSTTSTIEAMVEVLTDLDLIFSKNHLVPVNTAIFIISNEDGGPIYYLYKGFKI